MRVMTFSVAAMLLVAAGLAIFWPGRSAGPGLAIVAAQDREEATAKEQPPQAVLAKAPAPTLADKLTERHNYEFVETPLKDVVQILRDQTGIQFVLNAKRMEEAGVNIDTTVTKNLEQVRLGTFLDLMLDDLGLVYVERDDDLIIITTPEDAANTMEVRVYDCRDLLELATVAPALPGLAPRTGARGGGGGGFFGAIPAAPLAGPGLEILPQAGGLGGGDAGGGDAGGGQAGGQGAGVVTEHDLKADRLIQVVVTAVDPDSWTDAGGPGSISEFGGLIVISQSARTHKKIERVLDMLRQAAGLDVGKAKMIVR